MISFSTVQTLNQWLEAVEELPNVTDEERETARKVLEAAGLSLARVERGGIIYALRKVFSILAKEIPSDEPKDSTPNPSE